MEFKEQKMKEGKCQDADKLDNRAEAEDGITNGGSTVEEGSKTNRDRAADEDGIAGGTTAEEKMADDSSPRIVYPDYEDTWVSRLKEPEVAYGHGKRQGEYTMEDYYALPDDVYAELIDGVFFFKSSPTAVHQVIVGQLYVAFDLYIREKLGDCEPFMAPLDVKLGKDEKTVVQPDFLVICDTNKIQGGIVQAAPDFIAEILSPSTGNYDRIHKMRKYRESGVREYWIIDPIRQQIEVYIFRKRDMDVLPRVYSFEDEVPVGIYGGDFKADFSKIKQRIRRF